MSTMTEPKSSFRNVYLLGWVSFFNDVASEMIYPLVPLFLTTTLGAPASVVGIIEGIAESTAAIIKAVSGWISDRLRRRKPFVAAGYLVSAASKGILGLAFAWPVVLLARFADKVGKGTRTAARDALIAESVDKTSHGRAFGIHRAMDTLGAVCGPLIALALLTGFSGNMRLVFLLAVIPGLLGVALLIFMVREKQKAQSTAPQRAILPSFRALPGSFRTFLIVSIVFGVGNSSDAFLILRAQQMGFSATTIILLYTVFNLTYSLLSFPAGMISDRIGARRLLLIGFGLFAVVYAGVGLITTASWLWVLFAVYGLYMAMTEGVGKAYVASLVPQETLGTAFGAYQMVIGFCTLVSSILAGFLWTEVGVAAPFVVGAVMSVLAGLLFAVVCRRRAH